MINFSGITPLAEKLNLMTSSLKKLTALSDPYVLFSKTVK